jgi:hypothetical protein
MRRGRLHVLHLSHVLGLAVLLAAVAGCGGSALSAQESASPSASPSAAAAADDRDGLMDALDSFTFMTSTYEPKGDVVPESGAPRVFVAWVKKVDVDRRSFTFDVMKLYQGDDAYRSAGRPVDNAIFMRNDVHHLQTLRLASDVRVIYPYGPDNGILTLERFASPQMKHGRVCWLAVDGRRILMCVVVGHP